MLLQNNTESGQKTFAFTKGVKAEGELFLQKKQRLASLQWPSLSLAPIPDPKDGHQSLHLGHYSASRIFENFGLRPGDVEE